MIPERTVKVDGNCFWMEGDCLVFAPVDRYGAVEWDNQGELDSRAFRTDTHYRMFKASVLFLLHYPRC